jgi:N-acetylated-alpha-linked acidic dipeptidase
VSAKIDLVPLQDHVASFEAAGRDLNEATSRAVSHGHLNAAESDRVNEELMQVERNWSNPEGIPGRPWWKHTLYGARYTYAHLELPGLTEAAEAGNWARAAEQAKILESALMKNTELLRHVRKELDSAVAGDKQ